MKTTQKGLDSRIGGVPNNIKQKKKKKEKGVGQGGAQVYFEEFTSKSPSSVLVVLLYLLKSIGNTLRGTAELS